MGKPPVSEGMPQDSANRPAEDADVNRRGTDGVDPGIPVIGTAVLVINPFVDTIEKE
jgi:hypothetical protein